MSINITRLSDELRKDGFYPIWLDRRLGSYRYSRRSDSADMFEQIWIGSQGRKREAIYANAVVSVADSIACIRGLYNEEHIGELNTHKFRAYSLIETREAARIWEVNLKQIASDKVKDISRKWGGELLERTRAVRALTDKYEEATKRFKTMDSLAMQLKSIASPEQMARAVRLAESPGVCLFEGGGMLYETVCIALICFEETVEPERGIFSDVSPLENLDVMWRIQLLADRFLRGVGKGLAPNK